MNKINLVGNKRDFTAAFLLFLVFLAVASLAKADTTVNTKTAQPNVTTTPATTDAVNQRLHSLVPLDQLIPADVRDRIDRRKNLGQGSRLELPAVSTGVDLRYRDTTVKKQFGGTCTAFGLVAAMENTLGGHIDLSERDAWSKYQKYSAKIAE